MCKPLFNPLVADNTLVCGWRFEHDKQIDNYKHTMFNNNTFFNINISTIILVLYYNTSMHVVLRKYFFKIFW